MTGYVATRWYRAPEIMLNWMHYNQTGDVSPCAAAPWGRWAWGGGGAGTQRPRTLGDRPGGGPAFTNRPSERQSTVGPGLTLPPAQGCV